MKYSIVTPNENPKEATIEKLGVVVKFTMAEVEKHEAMLEKAKKEISAQQALEEAKMQNIESYHPFVLDMSAEDLSTASLYFTAKGIANQCIGKLDEIQQQLDEYAEEKAEIVKQIPALKTSPIVSEAKKILKTKGRKK